MTNVKCLMHISSAAKRQRDINLSAKCTYPARPTKRQRDINLSAKCTY